MKFRTTDDVKIPDKLMDQIIGQEKAVAIAKKAAKQHRNMLLIGLPGTGKTLLAQAMAELLPGAALEDVLVYKNVNNENVPVVKVVRTYPESLEKNKPLGDGQGRQIVQREKLKNRLETTQPSSNLVPVILLIVVILFILSISNIFSGYQLLVLGALILGVLIFGSTALFIGGLTRRVGMLPGAFDTNEPKLIVDNTGMNHAPFVDGTGSKAGALFGDVKHDPLQSGGLGTPPHLRVEGGAVHRANKGVLFIDEVASLDPRSQQELLTAMQEKKYSITGQSELSSGAIVRTEPVPSDFILIAAGNLQDMEKMHPALRSRIRGYGYEVYMESTIPDTKENVDKMIRFVSQEVKKDGKIPPFDYDACMEIVEEARRRSGRKKRLSLILRDLGGLVRAAGDLAVERSKKIVTKQEVIDAKKLAKPIEAQFVDQALEYRRDYDVFNTKGYAIGKVNGLAVMGSASYLSAGIVIPIVSEVTPASSRAEGKLIATGKLGKIAQEAVKNISAVIKRHMNRDIASYDIHVQFLLTEGVEGDSASISVAVAVISAMEGIPVDQSLAMTGSLSVRGEVLPVGGVTSKVDAAIDAGLKEVIIPRSNLQDIYIDKERLKKIKIVPVRNIAEVLEHSLKQSKRRDAIVRELKKYITSDSTEKPPLIVSSSGIQG